MRNFLAYFSMLSIGVAAAVTALVASANSGASSPFGHDEPTTGVSTSASTSDSTSTSTATSTATSTVAPAPVSGNATATAVFYKNLLGYSKFTQSGTSITVDGSYTRLRPNRSYFTVIYGNKNCDPAQAFPVGPFTTDGKGRATLNMTVAATVPVSGTQSMSVRRGDNNTDIDNDGKLGPSDVVAVPGSPSVGLIECNRHPWVAGN